MGLRTADEYRSSLRDGRQVYCEGELVEDVTTHPDIGIAVNHAALDFELAEHPEHRDLFTWQDPDAGGALCSRYSRNPRTPRTCSTGVR